MKYFAAIAIAAASAKNTHGRHHDLQSNYDAAFWNDFGNGFKVGFGGVMDGFGQIAPHIAAAIPGSEEYLVPMAGITQTINQGVQGIPINFALTQLNANNHRDLQSNYDAAFWNDFGNGFKVGFGGVMDGFGQIAPHIAAAIPGSEEYLVPMTGITQTINQGVQGIPINFALMQLDGWSDCEDSCAARRGRGTQGYVNCISLCRG